MRNKVNPWAGTLAGLALCTVSATALVGASAPALAANAYSERPTGVWIYTEDPNYTYAKGSASQMLSIQEAILHHSLAITIKRSLTDQFGFKVGCMVQNPTPLLELNVNSLDIRLFDSINDYVYARFIVDNNQEYSLRGEIAGRSRIIFAPITQAQERSLSDLFLQMREGGTLKIGLLQGERDRVRTYEIPLAGFLDYADRILQSCQSYNQSYHGKQQYLPDYMSKEPAGYAPKDYSLKQVEDQVIDPYAPQPEPPAPPVEEEETPKAPPREVLPFVPGGGPASIGPDGLPVGAAGSVVSTPSGSAAQSLGTASGPMQIGPDGMPIMNNNNQAAASANASAAGANAVSSANAAAGANAADAASGNAAPQGPSFDANGNLLPATGAQPPQQPQSQPQNGGNNVVMDNIF